MLFLDKTKPVLDPQIVGFIVILLGTTAMFINKIMITYIICAITAVYLLTVKAYGPLALYLLVYIVIALLMTNVDEIHSTSVMSAVVSLSCFAQKLVVLLMMGSFFIRITTSPCVSSVMQQVRIPDAAIIPIMVALHFLPMIRENYHNLRDSPRVRKVSLSLM